MKKYIYFAALFGGYLFLREFVSYSNVEYVDKGAFGVGVFILLMYLGGKVVSYYDWPAHRIFIPPLFVGYLFLRGYVSSSNVEYVDMGGLGIGGFILVTYLYRKATFYFSLPVKLRKHVQTDLDFFGLDTQLVTDVPNEVVRLYSGNRETAIPIVLFGYSTRALTEIKSYAKTASGMVNGEYVTLNTGEYTVYEAETGKIEIDFTGEFGPVGFSTVVDKVGLAKFKKLADRIEALGKPILERMQKEVDAIKKEFDDAFALGKKQAKESAHRECMSFVNECKVNPDKDPQSKFYWNYNYDDKGRITKAIVAGSNGLGGIIYNDGKDKWVGSWRGAKVDVSNDKLEVMVNDPEYRKNHLAERRITLPFPDKELRLAWFDRINILSKG